MSPPYKSLQFRFALIFRKKLETAGDVLPAGVAVVLTHVCTGTEKSISLSEISFKEISLSLLIMC